ncbi:MAG: hypothetical protein J6K48_11890 [Lachnospiraceae bacterium]|nr:hypothetical protein [Lachnospiraceae bacterium]
MIRYEIKVFHFPQWDGTPFLLEEPPMIDGSYFGVEGTAVILTDIVKKLYCNG